MFLTVRKPKESGKLVDEETEEAILEWVEANPELLNFRNKDFKNKSHKDGFWQDKAQAMQISVMKLKRWYTDLRDINTKLLKAKSGDPKRLFTNREQWIMARFHFLSAVVRHRRAPVASVKQAIAKSRGDLETAERIAAEDKIAIKALDDDDQAVESNQCQPSKRKKPSHENALESISKEMAGAQAELSAVRQALAATEPPTVRSTFLDFVAASCKTATEDQWDEFQTTFMTMQARWRRDTGQKQLQQQLLCKPKESMQFTGGPGFSTSHPMSHQSPSPYSEMYRPHHSRWTQPVASEYSPWSTDTSTSSVVRQALDIAQLSHNSSGLSASDDNGTVDELFGVNLDITQAKFVKK